MMRKTVRTILAGLGAILPGMLSCGCDNRPDGVLSQGRMTDLVVDLELAESYVERPGSGFTSDSSRKVLRQAVLREHGVSEEEYEATVDWYGYHIDQYTKLYEKAGEELRKRSGKAAASREDADVENLWPGAAMFTFMPGDYSCSESFSMDAGSLKPGDKLEWQMRMQGIGGRATAFLGVDYKDGETRYVTRTTPESGKLKLTIQTDSLETPTRIYGYLHLNESPLRPVWVDSISLVAYPLNSTTYDVERTHSRFSMKKNTSSLRK